MKEWDLFCFWYCESNKKKRTKKKKLFYNKQLTNFICWPGEHSMLEDNDRMHVHACLQDTTRDDRDKWIVGR